MKKIVVCLLLLFTLSPSIIAQTYDKHCYYGINFDVSKNRNWGYGELIITDVEPFSAAEAAGIKVNDIIMEIDGKATYLRDYQTIASWLFDNPSPEVTFTIRNVNTYFKEYKLERQCITVNSIDERFLAKLFSFYDLENNKEQTFTLPLKITPTNGVDLADYHTFSFYEDGSTLTDLDLKIQAQLEREFKRKGLTRNDTDPDIWVSFFYDYAPNPLFTGSTHTEPNNTLRFNTVSKQMERLPILDLAAYEKAGNKNAYPHIVKFGFTFYDRKYIDPAKYSQIWECSIEDYVGEKLSLLNYIEKLLPLITLQYPYSEPKETSEYYVAMSKYNYTGIHYDADDVGKVNDVDFDSPAYKAGIRAGYIINKMNEKSFLTNKKQITEGYRLFLEDTKKFRDPNTLFIGAEGYKECMYWNEADYGDIAKFFKKPKYQTIYSYLFDYAKYINPHNSSKLTIEAWDGVQKRIFSVEPIIREHTTINAYPNK